jgi:hypothetical protein
MSEFKVGDRVKVRDNAADFGSLENKVKPGATGVVVRYRVGGRYPFVVESGDQKEDFNSDQLCRATPDWNNLQVGDVLVETDGDEREIFAVVNDLVALHDGVSDGRRDFGWFHLKRLEERGWTIKQDSPADDTTELSVAEIETKLGVPAGTLRVKKD